MNVLKGFRAFLLVCGVVTIAQPLQVVARQNSDPSVISTQYALTKRNGQHDFDFAIGTWKTHILRLRHPLTGSTTWIEFNGIVIVRKVWDGRADLEELEANGATGRFEGLTLRLYNPGARVTADREHAALPSLAKAGCR